MAIPRVITLDRAHVRSIRLTRDNGGPVVAIAEYDVSTAAGTHGTTRAYTFEVTPSVQNQLNALWNAGVAQINTNEGTTTL